MTDHNALLERLLAWKDYDFHADRQLSDEVLIADGWVCAQDTNFSGGVRWSLGPMSVSEDTRPHPVLDLNTAIGVIPFGYDWRLSKARDRYMASVWNPAAPYELFGHSSAATLAILIAAVKTLAAIERAKDGA